MTSLTVFRKSEYIGKAREYKIILDEENIETIKSGEFIEIPVKPGSHELYLKVDWCQSNKIFFTIEQGGKLNVQCRFRGDWYNMICFLYYTLFKYKEYLLLEEVDEK